MRRAISRAILDHDAAAMEQLELRHSLGQLFVSRHIVERVEAVELDHLGLAALYDSRSCTTRSRWRLARRPARKTA